MERTFSRTGDGPDTDLPERSARGEGIPPVSDASFTKETHTRSLTQLPILGNMRQWTRASRANGEVLGATDVREGKKTRLRARSRVIYGNSERPRSQARPSEEARPRRTALWSRRTRQRPLPG